MTPRQVLPFPFSSNSRLLMFIVTQQWFALLSFYIFYLFFGAVVFYYIEHNKELEERAQQLQDRIKVNGKDSYSSLRYLIPLMCKTTLMIATASFLLHRTSRKICIS